MTKHDQFTKARDLYRPWSVSADSLPIFLQSWWLDATCGPEGWGVSLIQDAAGEIEAALPYRVQRRWGMTLLGQPPLTQFLGPWLRASGKQRLADQISREIDLIGRLVEGLPSYARYAQNWQHSRAMWLPCHWRGFQQSTRYTYVLEDISDETALWQGFKDNIRSDIRKAERRHCLVVDQEASLDEFLALNRKVFARQGMELPYTMDYVRRIDAACALHGCRRILIVRDDQGRAHAGAYLVWDEQNCYYLMGGGDPELRSSGATSLCIWAGIRFAATVTRCFDFEGSMLQPVERFFRAFGGRPRSFFRISHVPSRALRLAESARGILRGSA